jgi:hypothetical protein
MSTSKPKSPGKPERTGGARSNPNVKPDEPVNNSGRVTFDDRGEAIWEWSVETGKFQSSSTSTRLKKLTNVELSIVDDPLPADAQKVQPNPLGMKKGYNPYDSGRLSRDAAKKSAKKDLRKLGDWIKSKKNAGQPDGTE